MAGPEVGNRHVDHELSTNLLKSSSLQSILNSRHKGAPQAANSRPGAAIALIVPWLLFAGFISLSLLLFGDRLVKATHVEVETVVTVRAAVSDPASAGITPPAEQRVVDPWASAMLFQASGWIEPDPLPIKATALLDGVVNDVSVLEGETVSQGQALATLVREDFELNLASAESQLRSIEARDKANEQAILAASAQILTLEKKVMAGHRKRLELEDRRDRLASATGGAVSDGEVVQSGLQVQTHQSEIDALDATRAELESEVARLVATREEYAAGIELARTEIDRRKLALDRTEIRSPVDGVVLRLFAVPGQKLMLGMDDPDSSTVAILYQPGHLQSRIDVPLEEAAQLSVGQAVRIRSNFLPDRLFKGTVTRIVGEADLQRNTLQVKVRISEPDPRLRPEMLCRAEFLASPADGKGSVLSGGAEAEAGSGIAEISERVSVFVSERAFVEREATTALVWAVDFSGDRIESRRIELGHEQRDGYLAVRSGLRPGDRVVINPSRDLVAGERIESRNTAEMK